MWAIGFCTRLPIDSLRVILSGVKARAISAHAPSRSGMNSKELTAAQSKEPSVEGLGRCVARMEASGHPRLVSVSSTRFGHGMRIDALT
jgi:hypothetical protein